MNPQTRSELKARYADHGGSIRAFARLLGIAHGVVADVLTGRDTHVSASAENRIRCAINLDPLPIIRETIACPSCGTDHGRGLDCHGLPIREVVILRGADTVRRRKPKAAWLDQAVANLETLIAQRNT